LRPLIAILGAAALVFGIVVLVNAWSDNLNHWLAATHRTGWLFTIAGAVLLVFALFSPSFYMGGTRHRAVRHEVVS
jgi:hypothetical protein